MRLLEIARPLLYAGILVVAALAVLLPYLPQLYARARGRRGERIVFGSGSED